MTDAYRVVHGEGDRLPALVVDRYGDSLVMQTLDQGMDAAKSVIASCLEEIFRPRGIVARNDAAVRTKEEDTSPDFAEEKPQTHLDYAMPAIDGGQVAAAMKHIKPSVPILMLSGVPHVPEQDLANIDAFVQKGQEPAVVLQKIEQLLARPEQAA